MCFQCHMRVCVLWLAAKAWVLIGSLVLIIGLFSTGLLKLQSNSTAWLPIRTDSLASITYYVQFLFLLSLRTLKLLYFLVIFVLSFYRGCMEVYGKSTVAASVYCASRHFFQMPSAEVKKPPDLLFSPFFTASPVIARPFEHPPRGLPPCFMPSDTHWDQTRSPDPLLGLPLKVLMALFVWGTSSPSSLAASSPALQLRPVIALPLVCFLYDLSSPGSGRQLNFHYRSVRLVGKWCGSCRVGGIERTNTCRCFTDTSVDMSANMSHGVDFCISNSYQAYSFMLRVIIEKWAGTVW